MFIILCRLFIYMEIRFSSKGFYMYLFREITALKSGAVAVLMGGMWGFSS